MTQWPATRAGWPTIQAQRHLVVAVHNVTAATRLLDILSLVAQDHRIQSHFTITGSSAFTAGTEQFLIEQGINPIAWESAIRLPKDLVITASHGGHLRELGAPIVIVPHGIGYNKYLNRETGKQGNRETGKQGNRETGKQGNRETGKQGNRETGLRFVG